MKKKIALFLSALMMFSLLAACGSTGASSSAAASGADTSASSADATVLKVWIPPYAGGDAEYTDMDFWTEQFKDFEQENNCKVEVSIFPWTGYMQKITTGMNSGEGPDVVYIDTLYDLAAAGALEPLDSYFTQEEKDNYYYYDMGNVAGDQYVLPMMVGDASVLFCNMDILKEAGFDAPPTTWEELIAYSKKIKEVRPDIYSFIQPWGNASSKSAMMTSFLPYFWQAGGDFLDADGKPNLNSEAGKTTLDFLKSLQDEGIFDDTVVSVGDAPDLFRNGEAAMVMMGTGMAASVDKAGINWDFSTLKGPNGQEGFWISGDSLAVAANSTHKELAVKALKYMTSAKVMDAFHEKLYAMTPLTKDGAFTEDERFQKIYESEAEIANFHIYYNPENHVNNTEAIRAYLMRAILFTYFQSGTTSKLQQMKSNINSYDYEITVEMLDQITDLRVTDGKIEDILNAEKGSRVAGDALYYLCLEWTNKNFKYEQDHLHPYDRFDGNKPISVSMEDWRRWRGLRNRLPNLQLLEGRSNGSKNNMRLIDYYNDMNDAQKADFYKQAIIPEGVSLEIEHFEELYNKRKEMLAARIKALLG